VRRYGPALLTAEGLAWYLTEDENARLLDNLASLTAPGSRFGIDIVSRDFLENPAVVPFFELTAAHGIRWQFGTNDPAGFLAAHVWQAEVSYFDVVARDLGPGHRPGSQKRSPLALPPRAAATFITAECTAGKDRGLGPAFVLRG
jgi:O-methyltransferase involved in polyketide biosynthesis